MENLSYSQLSAYQYCALSYKYKYLDKLKVEPDNTDPSNALFIGQAMHEGIEKGIDAALALYDSFYPLKEDKHEEEKIKLEYLIPKVQAMLPAGDKRFEFFIRFNNFIGYIDLLVKTGEKRFELYDFKYSSNPDKYKESPQIHLYRYALSQLYPAIEISRMGYIMIPKTSIRLKKDEVVSSFRDRLRNLLDNAQPYILDVSYNEDLALESLKQLQGLDDLPIYPLTEDKKKCRWCEYEPYCRTGNIDMIPLNQPRPAQESWQFIKVYMYGAPYAGKTTAAQTFPDPLFFNTDGNYNSFSAPYIPVRDSEINGIKVDAWDQFKMDVDEFLATPEYNGFKTVVLDQVEGLYEYCRANVCKRLHIQHESDDNFKAWDQVRTEYYSVIKKLASAPNLNLVLISQEDNTRDFFSRSGNKVTSFKPNLQEKVAIRLASLVDMTVRLVRKDNGAFFLFSSDSHQFSGCRISNPPDSLPANYPALKQWIDSVNQAKLAIPVQVIPPVAPVAPVQQFAPQPQLVPVQQVFNQ